MPKTQFAKAMDAKGLKAEELAFKAGITVGYLYKLRRGEQVPSLEVAARLADLLDVDMKIFLLNNCRQRTKRKAATG